MYKYILCQPGATTYAEYRSHIEKDSAFERRFQPVQVRYICRYMYGYIYIYIHICIYIYVSG